MARSRFWGWCFLGSVFIGFLSTTSHAEGFQPNFDNQQPPNSSGSSGWAPTVKRAPIVIPGTGDLIGQPPKGLGISQEKGEITLNFTDADMTEVVQAVLGDALGLNYVLSPKVQGNLTIRTSRPLARADVLSIFDAALRVQGATIVKTENVYQVVPISEAPGSAAAPMVRAKPSGRSPGYGIEVVRLRYVSAAQMEPVLKSTGPQDSILYVDTARNSATSRRDA